MCQVRTGICRCLSQMTRHHWTHTNLFHAWPCAVTCRACVMLARLPCQQRCGKLVNAVTTCICGVMRICGLRRRIARAREQESRGKPNRMAPLAIGIVALQQKPIAVRHGYVSRDGDAVHPSANAAARSRCCFWPARQMPARVACPCGCRMPLL